MRIKYIINKDPRVKDFNNLIKNNFPQLLTEKRPQLYLVAGGDGAMLHAINKTIDKHIPYLGKALGTFNFLMNNIVDDKSTISTLLNDSVKISTFSTNAIKAYLNGKKIGEAVNDVILGNKLYDYFTYNIATKGKDLDNFEVKGSGLCISTAIGSTAFNYNNGGRILPLDSNFLSITGVVCNRYLNDILPFEDIHIKSNGARVYLTSSNSFKLNQEDTLLLKKGTEIEIAFLNKDDFLKRRIDISHRFRK
jgi:NAD+ kinase